MSPQGSVGGLWKIFSQVHVAVVFGVEAIQDTNLHKSQIKMRSVWFVVFLSALFLRGKVQAVSLRLADVPCQRTITVGPEVTSIGTADVDSPYLDFTVRTIVQNWNWSLSIDFTPFKMLRSVKIVNHKWRKADFMFWINWWVGNRNDRVTKLRVLFAMQHCRWNITGPLNTQLRISFDSEFDVEKPAGTSLGVW